MSPWARTLSVWRHPANRGARLRAVLRGALWLAYRHLSSSPVRRAGPGGFRYYCLPGNNFCKRMVLYSGLPDYPEMSFMLHYLRPGDGFLDVGANCGIFTLLAAALVGEGGRVEAFEPGEGAGRWLRRNLELNGFGQVGVHAAAVGAARSRVAFLRDFDVGNRIRAAVDGGLGTVEVDCVRLDDELAGRSFALAKVDVEGAEPLVLEGAAGLLAAGNPPVWILELNGKLRHFGYTEAELEGWLGGRGYELAVYEPETRRLRRGPRLWEEPGPEPEEKNLLAVRVEDLPAIAERVHGGAADGS